MVRGGTKRTSRPLSLVAVVAVTAAFVACRATVDFDGDGGASATPTIPLLDPGDALDGDLSVTTTVAYVNTCQEVVTAAGTEILVQDAQGFREGRRILLMQTQDALVTATHAEAVEAGSAGLWEIARVAEIQSSLKTLVPEDPLHGTYASVSGVRAAQACTLPEFGSVSVASPGYVSARPWNGRFGGVLAFLARDRVEVGAGFGLFAGGMGFNGGLYKGPASPSCPSPSDDVDPTSQAAGGKGEGTDGRSDARTGRGSFASAGGGGHCNKGSGGGGGNGGRGGYGARASGSGDAGTRGEPGARVIEPTGTIRLLLGGGGGGGHDGAADTLYASVGARGGGIVLVVTDRLEGTGTIQANGGNTYTSGSDRKSVGSGKSVLDGV